MQLLRHGLVNHTTLGKTFQKENKDIYIIIGMVTDGCECIMCLISLIICIKLNYDVKHDRFKTNRKEGAFFVQIVSDKDIVVVQSKKSKKNSTRADSFLTRKPVNNSKSNKKTFGDAV